MSIHVKILVGNEVKEHPQYSAYDSKGWKLKMRRFFQFPDETIGFLESSPDTTLFICETRGTDQPYIYREFEEHELSEAADPKSVELPDGLYRETIITHRFVCAELRRAGRYKIETHEGQAEAWLSHEPPLKDWPAQTYGCHVTVRIAGNHAIAFELYRLIRAGKVGPVEDWDAPQAPAFRR